MQVDRELSDWLQMVLLDAREEQASKAEGNVCGLEQEKHHQGGHGGWVETRRSRRTPTEST